MISVEEAKAILLKHVGMMNRDQINPVPDSLGFRLAHNIYSPIDLPPFNQSNVDGYALNLSQEGKKWKVINEVKAGDDPEYTIGHGEAVRIFTGATVPSGSNCVVMQENLSRDGDTIFFNNKFHAVKGDHIRLKGSQIKKGSMAAEKGLFLNPAAIGFISAMGIVRIPVFSKPKISVIITGNELQSPGTILEKGKVYESNSLLLSGALNGMNLEIDSLVKVKDEKDLLAKAVKEELGKADILLISGGISVGDYDFVNEVLIEAGTEVLFYKVAQKPGKPLLFGKNKNSLVFGLPGNPSSTLTCFYEYVYPAIRKMQGYESVFMRSTQMPILSGYQKRNGLASFLKAKIFADGVLPLIGQESFMLKSSSVSDALIYLPGECENVKNADMVEVHLLPEV